MAAAEVDGFAFAKYSKEERAVHRASFYRKYLSPTVVWVEDEEDNTDIEANLNK
jgi:hypothetical protein